MANRTYKSPPILFPNPPRNASPEMLEYHRKLEEYIKRLTDFLRVNFETNGDGTTTTGTGGDFVVNSDFLTLGRVTITDARITNVTAIFLTKRHTGGPVAHVFVENQTIGSFDIVSSNAADNDLVYWAFTKTFPLT